MWNTYGEAENAMVLRGHRNAVIDIQYADERFVGYSVISLIYNGWI